MSETNPVERGLERTLFASRWLMAPMYLGLVVALVMLLIVFFNEVFYYAPQAFEMTADKAILAVLTLIDLTLAANLLVIVLFSGYENFVSRLDTGGSDDRPAWMGTVDFGGLKLKLIASIVAISGIHLLKRFMELGKGTDGALNEPELKWLVIIHLVFVFSGVLMAAMDWITANAKYKKS
ncbi:MAG TPA: TIGR00645 family protein [Rhodobacterales bacterium]|nr:TIGR00645 family protein [Rhodobacterales bacterium]